jgi:nucleoside-diphosphate-sugar epimerase
MDNSRLNSLGWRPKTSIAVGLEKMYAWFLQSQDARIS